MERRLAAVLIADVTGYGRLSQADEEGTRARFQADLREIFEPTIANHRGRLVKTMGDGLLVEFPSVVDALRCAVELQRAEAERNATLPLERRMTFRIGINLGDVIVEGDDIHGDGVNIADRMQALAEPGGIAISGTAYDHVKAKLPVGYASLGEQQVKSIAEPVRVYRVLMDPAAAGRTLAAARHRRRSFGLPAAAAAILLLAAGAATMAWWRLWQPAAETDQSQSVVAALSDKPSLVVLPFDSLSEDQEQAYLADGMIEDMTTELARLPGLFVISRKAAFTYKGKAVPPAQVGQELGVRYVLEGSIRRVGDDLRINAQLIDTASNGHLWAERFDGAWGDVFTLQDQVVEKVAEALELRLVSGARLAEAPGATIVPAAYDLYLQAYGIDYRKSPAEVASRLRQAVALDPNFGQAWAELGWVYRTNQYDEEGAAALGTPSSQMGTKLKEILREAEKHPSSSYHNLMADIQIWQRQSDEAISSAGRAIALDPSDPWAHETMSLALVINGRAADAQSYLDVTSRIDPQPWPYRGVLAALVAFSMERFDDAVALLEKVQPQELSDDFMRRQRLYLLTAAHAHLGHTSEAATARAELEALRKDASSFQAMGDFPFKQRADAERLQNGLGKAGLPEFPFGLDAKNRLTGEEIRALVFGHELRGRQIEPDEPYVRTTTTEGAAHVTVGSSESLAGVSRMEGDLLCSMWDSDVELACATIFRNPGGTPENQNEYVFVVPTNRLEFSRVK
jgi:TolB-like protein/class 3 adenylate cyclase